MTTLSEWAISPDLTVAVDAATCIVLRTPERTITVSSVARLVAALEEARIYAQIELDLRDTDPQRAPRGWQGGDS